ncbi:MAG: restriction endonuclease [Bacteroidales bacterium]|jgi:hypothetical protein|nr:hypothetical protein [Bacteroidales bacterium]MCK9498788.1 hypothetical protein [Bacteroidales bacterium]MDY0315154.1 hypothetical protein [Bacteroidales bacterium]NLB86567.1 restriction endonuclease [Bacteroidales bacterium]
MNSFAEIDIQNKGNYIKLLAGISKLSKLFSDSSIPFINYRFIENAFCKCFNAENLSRSDTAFDASYNSIGIGLKTFICTKESSDEKIAEFNSLSKVLATKSNEALAFKLSQFRNERIDLAKRVYGIQNSLYHIVARRDGKLLLFETNYDYINIDKIHSIKQNTKSIKFNDDKNSYSYNFSKSTLFRKFHIPNNSFVLPIEIIEDPYQLLIELYENSLPKIDLLKPSYIFDYVVLPLYGYKNKQKFIYKKSGLNQWNAGGRDRDSSEVYIPVPIEIHKKNPNFFPARDISFNLIVPTKETLKAKLCQDNAKALMTSPNKALADWLLRKVLKLKEGELATIEKLNELGFDSVIITKIDELNYKIDIAKTNTFETFIKSPITKMY